ncbi:acyl-CoA dehydrogenase [Terrilactibacillus sp. BCM23-1]|uniref:Acyl-CoA dehydrogenase n=1 Tax=Terrilactibacillus tamarindi TaxID=2599694 RepID=A0A6N8CV88_9BACI|nr:acyl-CoA dehydrogenase family protein [Terrilactibacillus tamarindi]MTT33115.1 acyl-CoA dehydrogenase [Terrilactibacillus tamarindi]
MFDPYASFIKNDRHKELVNMAKAHAKKFKLRAANYDKEASFPFENFAELKESGYTALSVPKSYGGQDLSLYEFALIQENIAQGDGPTALCAGWHLGIVMDLATRREWEPSNFEKICKKIVQDKIVINRAATEPKTGSPTRGGKPETEAVQTEDGWLINGHKTFTSLAPIADYFIVSASIKGSDDIGGFLVPRDAAGVSTKQTWDTLGMRATRSDDLIIDHVKIDKNAYVERIGWQDKKHTPPGWLIHIPACYLGIALGCRQDMIEFAANYKPNSLNHPISELEHIKNKVGQIDLELMKARYLMYGVAAEWDEFPERRENLGPELQAVKYAATNAALKAVDLAMRVVGGTSLFRSEPFERYYRDIRAGIHNPPSDDIVLQTLGKRAFERE